MVFFPSMKIYCEVEEIRIGISHIYVYTYIIKYTMKFVQTAKRREREESD